MITHIGWHPGTLIDQPGVYPLIPITEYHNQLTVSHSASHSSLERIWKHSLALYWDRCYANPNRFDEPPTESMVLGQAAHHLFLGQRGFTQRFVARPAKLLGYAWNSNRKEHKAWLEDQRVKGLTVLTQKQIEQITGMARQLSSDPLVRSGLLSGRVECSLISLDRETGIWMKSRPDAIPTDFDFVDLKVTNDISEEGIQRTIGTFGYHRQAALVCECMAAITGTPLRFRAPGGGEGYSSSLCFVEADRPHCIRVVTLKVADLERGVEENRLALRLLRRALDENQWPGPAGDQKDADFLGMTPWSERDSDYRQEQLKRQLAIGARS